MEARSYLRAIGTFVVGFGLVVAIGLLFFSTGPQFVAEEACLSLLVTGSIVMLLSFYIQESESAIWSVNSKIARLARIGITACLMSFLFVFFVPIIPYRITTTCWFYSCPVIPTGGAMIGFYSIGVIFFNFGASISTNGFPPSYMVGIVTPLALTFIVLPTIVISLLIMSPEVISLMRYLKSRISASLTRRQEIGLPVVR